MMYGLRIASVLFSASWKFETVHRVRFMASAARGCRLSPVAALESPLAPVFAPVAGDPDGAGPRRAQPAAIHPEPAPASPIPVAVGPHIAWSGSVTHDTVSGRWRRAEPNRRVPVAGNAPRQDHAREGRAQKKESFHFATS